LAPAGLPRKAVVRAEECRGEKLGMCGLGEVRLAASVMEVELAVACDDLAAAAFSDCVAR
jgi:hypothetical protein